MLPGRLDKIEGTAKGVTDMGSTKASIAEASKNHSGRGRYVAVHPMAGTEYSGPLAAIGKLFDYKNAIICDKALSDNDALVLVEKMLDLLNMHKVYMNSSDHDVHVAYVSHISHTSSFSLAFIALTKAPE